MDRATPKMAFSKNTWSYGKNFAVKSESKVWMQYCCVHYYVIWDIYLHRKETLLKLDFGLFTDLCVALKIVLNKSLLGEYLHN